MARKASDEIEVVFGLRQVLLIAVLVTLVLGGTYFCGVEQGRSRALRGEPSLLAFLEGTVDPHSGPVPIPEILLKELGADVPEAEPAEPVESAPAPSTSEAVPERPEIEREKPSPGIEPKPEPAPEPAPQPVRRPPRIELHYQVAALSVPRNAKALVDWLRGEGFPAGIRPIGTDGLYRIYVGPFGTYEDAQSAKDRLLKDGFTVMARRF